MVLLGSRLLPRLMAEIAKLNSRELFLLAITAIGLGIGYATYLAGLSFSFGAFVAGMVLSESDYGHQALSDIIPVRDLFGLLFFASVGMLLDPVFLVDNLGQVLGLVVVVCIGKGVIFALLARWFAYGNVVPLAVGLGLFQIGEFSLVLGRMGVASGSIDDQLYSLVLTGAVVTMLLTPLVSGQTARFYALKKKWFRHEPLETINIPRSGLCRHVVIAGGGRVGFQIAQVLKRLGLKFVLIEIDQRRLEAAKVIDVPVVYGDASQKIVLEAAMIESACLLLVTTPGIIVSRTIVAHARQINPELDIVARASGMEFLGTFKALNVAEVVLPEFEAGLEMTRKALLYLRVPVHEILHYTEALRREMVTSLLHASGEYRTLAQLRVAEHQFELQWIRLELNSPLIGQSIGESKVRTRTGASVVGVSRADKLIPFS
jgi:CPA2 family monovalent cation:H+ antiporter-2